MTTKTEGTAAHGVQLRKVQQADIEIFFAHEHNAEAQRLAAFTPRNRVAFAAHWTRLLADPTLITRTIVADGQVAGNIGCWEQDGEREIGYWLGRQFWGRGIATQAVRLFLEEVTARPLYAHVARHNSASRRVLEKAGFTVHGEDKEFAVVDGKTVEGVILILDAPPKQHTADAADQKPGPATGQPDTVPAKAAGGQ
jgi:RimJ/RimL family protein N-acetyltransferase